MKKVENQSLEDYSGVWRIGISSPAQHYILCATTTTTHTKSSHWCNIDTNTGAKQLLADLGLISTSVGEKMQIWCYKPGQNPMIVEIIDFSRDSVAAVWLNEYDVPARLSSNGCFCM